MLEYLAEYGLFLAKAITIVAAILAIAGSLVSLAMRQKQNSSKQLEITHLNKQFKEMEKTLCAATLSEVGMKQKLKAEKKQAKLDAKAEKKANKGAKDDSPPGQKRLFVLDFEGDMKASNVESMRQEISALLTIAGESDEVLVRLESAGGTVHGYGLGASQLKRIRDRNIPLTVAVDKVAASGGYMMACVANQIIAAPFAILGSIGVLAQMPNLNRLLKRHDVDYEQLYAGEYKRTLTLFGENTDKGRAKMQADLEETHQLFKEFVKSQRPGLDIDRVATGEHWLGTRALELGLVDALVTSDDYLMSMNRDAEILQIEYSEKKTLMEKMSNLMSFRFRQQQKEVQDLDKPLLM
ncbi:MAG: protease SohB [Gammaproteobacteria bacterium]|nr:protease SohB [Gammaproteobacteria bacterium]